MATPYSAFEGAHHFTIGTNYQISANNYIHNEGNPSNRGLDVLHENAAINAVHDSAERCDAPKCMPETRVAVQAEILSWIAYGDRDSKPKKMLWVTGPAGTGKTAILGTIADECQEKGQLAASFFFSSFSASQNRRSKRCLISTIAYQLVQHPGLQGIQDGVFAAVERNPAIFKKQLKEQLEMLILSPLRQFAASNPEPSTTRPRVVVIDGLDECDAELFVDPTRHGAAPRSKVDEQREILAVLTQAANDPSFPFRIVIASRPERHIRDFFSEMGEDDLLELFLDEKYHPDADIALFLRSKFGEIRRRFKLPELWPGDKVIETLVENASGQFIYAATVMRFIEGPASPPHEQLQHVLRARVVRDGTNPFSALDTLYSCILESCPSPKLSMTWLRALPYSQEAHPFKNAFNRYYDRIDKSNAMSINFIPPAAHFVNQFFESSLGEAEYALGGLSSLLHAPPMEDYDSPFSFYHKSFLDFMDDPARAGDLYVAMGLVNDFLRSRMFATLKNKGPVMPLTGEAQKRFLREFTRISGPALLSCPSKARFDELKKEYTACDAHWWVEALLDTSEDGYGPYALNQHSIHEMFRTMHGWCSSIKCSPSCKHWRSAILKVCKMRGWSVPGKMELLQNKWNYPRAQYTPFTLESMERIKPILITS